MTENISTSMSSIYKIAMLPHEYLLTGSNRDAAQAVDAARAIDGAGSVMPEGGLSDHAVIAADLLAD